MTWIILGLILGLIIAGILHITEPIRSLSREQRSPRKPKRIRPADQAILADAARKDAEARWKALEAEHAAECLSALTNADVEWLKWWGWEPDAATARVLRQAEVERDRQAALRRRVEKDAQACQEREQRDAAARAAGKPTQSELAAEADRRVQGGDVLPRDVVVGSTIHAGGVALGALPYAEVERLLTLERSLALSRLSDIGMGIYVADQRDPIRYI